MDGYEPSESSYESYTFDEHCTAIAMAAPSVCPSVTNALCVIATDVNNSFESFSSSFRKLNLVDEGYP